MKTSKENGLELNMDEIKYINMMQNQNPSEKSKYNCA